MDVIVNGFGSSSNVPAQVDPSTAAIRTTQRPTEWVQGSVIGGHYKAGAQTGTMAAGIASAAQVFQVRWADPVKLFILKRLIVQCATGTGFAAVSLGAPLELILGHGSTANGSGGAVLAITGSSNKLRPLMAASGFATSGEVRIATTGALTAATGQVLEPVAIAECLGAPNATLAQSPQMTLFDSTDSGGHELVLNSGDTLAVRTLNPAATGTWFACFHLKWVEAVSL